VVGTVNLLNMAAWPQWFLVFYCTSLLKLLSLLIF
jgi:hypothetical protein